METDEKAIYDKAYCIFQIVKTTITSFDGDDFGEDDDDADNDDSGELTWIILSFS